MLTNRMAITFYGDGKKILNRYDDTDVQDREEFINADDIQPEVLASWFNRLKGGWGGGENWKYLGINSSSINETDYHHLFLEWDMRDPRIDVHKLSEGGILTKTGKGWHIIKEDKLSFNDLINIQKKYKCCDGFIKRSRTRGYSCLRVSEKAHSPLIIDHASGKLGYIYQFMVNGMKSQKVNVFCRGCSTMYNTMRGQELYCPHCRHGEKGYAY